jgi:Major Facilitator Superfamily
MLVPAALSVLAQLTQGIIGLALLLVGHETHLSVPTSALAVSAFAVGMAAGRPVQGRALDRLSPRAVLTGCGTAHAVAYLLLALVAHQHWTAAYVLGGLIAGLTLPPIGTQQRVSWPQQAAPGTATRMFALIQTLQQVSVLLAPVLFTAVAALWSPTAAMLVLAAVAGASTVLFARTAPRSPYARPDGERPPVRSYLGPLLLTGLLGAATGTVEVAAPALALHAGHPGYAGPLVATATVGTVLGAVFAMSGAGRRVGTYPLLAVSAAVQAVGAVVLLLPAPLAVTGAGLLVLGAGFTPAYAAAAVLVHLRAGGTAEAFGWQSTALGLGVAGGSAAAGGLVGVAAHLSALPAVLGPAACVVLAAVGPRRAGRVQPATSAARR